MLSNTHNEEARELNEIIQQTLPYVCEQEATVEAVDCLLKKVKELKQRAEKPQGYCLYIIVDYVSKVKLVFDPERADPTKIKKVNHLLVIIYDFLLWTCKDNPLICQKLWHYARQFYLLTCDNSSVNYLHIHLVLLTVCQLGPQRLTPYSIELFAEILQKFGDYFTEDVKKKIIDITLTNKNAIEANRGNRCILKDKKLLINFMKGLKVDVINSLLDSKNYKLTLKDNIDNEEAKDGADNCNNPSLPKNNWIQDYIIELQPKCLVQL